MKGTLDDALEAELEAAVAAEEGDPMNALEDVAVAALETPKKRPRKYYVSKRAMNTVTKTEMPERERSSFPNNEGRRQIQLLPTSTNSLWISAEDIEWLVDWLAAEYRSGGVALEEGDQLASLEGNCSVPNVHIRWSFDRAWEAVVLAGPRKGATRKTYVEKLTAEKWQKADDFHKYAVAYEMATPRDKKLAAFHFLEAHMRTFLGEDAALPIEPAVAGN